MTFHSYPKFVIGTTLLVVSAGALAHTGHGADGFMAGLEHPLGADHLLATLAVGLWSVFALPAGRAWQGPATFMLALVVSALLGASGVNVPYLEHAIAASVVVFGLMLVLATHQLPVFMGLSLIGVAASLHGLAHGAEAPASSAFATYAAGFLLTTAVLHFGGVFAGLSVRRWFAQHAIKIMGGLGVAFSGAGVFLLAQLATAS